MTRLLKCVALVAAISTSMGILLTQGFGADWHVLSEHQTIGVPSHVAVGRTSVGPVSVLVTDDPVSGEMALSVESINDGVQLLRQTLSYRPTGLSINSAGDMAFMVGVSGTGKVILAVVQLSSMSYGQRELPISAGVPIIALGQSDRILIADGNGDDVFILRTAEPNAELGKPHSAESFLKSVTPEKAIKYKGPGHVAGIAASGKRDKLLISDSKELRISAIRDDGTVLEVFSRQVTKSPIAKVIPYSMGLLLSAGPSDEFIVADYAADSLLQMFYDNELDVFTVGAVASVGIPLVPGSNLASTPEVPSPTLISSDPFFTDVMFVGNRNSRTLLVYSRRPNFPLELVGKLELAEQPSGVAVSPAANAAVVTFADHGQYAIIGRSDGERTGSVTSFVKVGADDVRELQRLLTAKGYPVGAIDGIVGPRTQQAMRQLNADVPDHVTLKNIPATIRVLDAGDVRGYGSFVEGKSRF